jgi:hypothetical protein
LTALAAGMVIALPATEIGGRMPVVIAMDFPGAALNQYDQVIAGMGRCWADRLFPADSSTG